MNLHNFVLPLGFLLDLLLGDPRWLYHPICLVGNGISFLEKLLRRVFGCEQPGSHPGRETAAGAVLVFLENLLINRVDFKGEAGEET